MVWRILLLGSLVFGPLCWSMVPGSEPGRVDRDRSAIRAARIAKVERARPSIDLDRGSMIALLLISCLSSDR